MDQRSERMQGPAAEGPLVTSVSPEKIRHLIETERELLGPEAPSVIAALEGGPHTARDIARRVGRHVSTVRKILRGYEREGRAGRWCGSGSRPDGWELVPPEHAADARRRYAERAPSALAAS
jgi:DNA-binding MarR family transcriptional regulator